MPDTTTDSAHRKSPSKIAKDYPWTKDVFQVRLGACAMQYKYLPWISLMVRVSHKQNKVTVNEVEVTDFVVGAKNNFHIRAGFRSRY